jgi:ABC-type antimicrobial peptide transport system permease subunit
VTQYFQAVLVAIIHIFAGGRIGIMNIMLVSVTEHARNRLYIGYQRSDIRSSSG